MDLDRNENHCCYHNLWTTPNTVQRRFCGEDEERKEIMKVVRECEVYGVGDNEDILKVISEYGMGVIVKCGIFDYNVEINFESKFSFYFCKTIDENGVYDIDGCRIHRKCVYGELFGGDVTEERLAFLKKYCLVVLERRNWKDYYYKYFCAKCVSNNLGESD